MNKCLSCVKPLFCVLLLLLLCNLPQSVWAQALTRTADVVELAEQQRMLSQRMAKNWVLLAHEARAKEQQQQLNQGISQFERNLDNLSRANKQRADHGWTSELDLLKQQWVGYRAQLLSAPNRQTVPAVLGHAEQVLQRSQALIERVGNRPRALDPIVDISAEQQMLSQRIALLYATQTQFGATGDLGLQYQQAIQDFVHGLKRLSSAQALLSPELRQQLAAIESRWRFAEHVFQQPRSMSRLVDANCEQLLQDMGLLTQRYLSQQAR